MLLKTDFRESDRMVCVYSLEHGRMALRMPGVNKHSSKLKAIGEPFAKSCARIYIRRNAAIGCITGGKIENVHPGLRADYNKTQLAAYFCELFYRLTPDHSPNEEKFALLEDSLLQLETAPINPGMAPAFLLRLMHLSGYGLKDMPVLNIPPAFWDMMHTAPLGSLSFLDKEDLPNLNKARHVCKRFLNNYLQHPIYTINQLDLTAPIDIEEAAKETALEPAAVLAA